ncbi:MAG: amidohydrolase family protein [Acidobacteriota bacterium]
MAEIDTDIARARSAQAAHREDWLALVDEPVYEPDWEIIDPHHHLWQRGGTLYEIDALRADAAGHRVTKSIFIECRSFHRTDGPKHLRPVGETEYVLGLIEKSGPGGADEPDVAALVCHADMRLEPALLDEVLDAHEAAGKGRFRGIRHSAAWDAQAAESFAIPGRGPAGLCLDTDYQRGVRRLGERGLTFDCWLYHTQMEEFGALVDAAPETTIILDHFAHPLGVARFSAEPQEARFPAWKDAMSRLAERPNLMAKLGGLAMPDNGFSWHLGERPPTSDEFAEQQSPWIEHAISVFGPDRCMFESNFPNDETYTMTFNSAL